MAWVTVARVSEMSAGAGKTIIANGKELALFLLDGQFYCMDNSCPHLEGPLAEGYIEGEIVYCPWHWWPISIRTGELTHDPTVCNETFACRVDGDAILVDIPE